MERIVEIGIKRLEWPNREEIPFTKDPKANDLLNDIAYNPHVFVLACLMDRQIKAEKAWIIPQKIFDIIGSHDFKDLESISLEEYKKIFTKNKLHRFNNDMAEIFYKGVNSIKAKYNGNASEIWEGRPRPSSALVVYRFLEFYGCGIKIATMATNILARQFKIKFSDYFSIDISPDVHVKRVLSRMGFVPHNPSPEMVIYKARELHPEFPGVIDFSCWEIGREYCLATNPICNECIVSSSCKKIGVPIFITEPAKVPNAPSALYAEKFGVEISSNWSGLIGLTQIKGKTKRYIYTRISWSDVIVRMRIGLALGTDYLIDTLIKTGHVWEKHSHSAKIPDSWKT
ncbi:MAG: hypothetical protein LBC85_01445 [Fibromonadaceae bacterium]|jgi:endonuclease III|nr:hypothetical protein [Fibromonadaceae bacterium]